MKSIALLLFLLFSSAAFCQAVLFGERDRRLDVQRLYFDENGFLYPDLFISDSSLTTSGSNLAQWYDLHPAESNRLLQQFNISPIWIVAADDKSGNNKHISWLSLNDSLIAQKMRQINALRVEKDSVAFYIHGFRKEYRELGTNNTSVKEFNLLKNALSASQNKLEIEVYWDGTYDCCFSMQHKKNKALFQLFERAQENADKVAESFLKILTQTNAKQVQVIAHSLGARVASKAIFSSRYLMQKPSTQLLQLVLLAPAISGELIRNQIGNDLKTVNLSSLSLVIFYNEKDFVLKKKDPKLGLFGPGARKYGVTTLGCNKRNDAEKTKDLLAKLHPEMNCLLIDKSDLGKCHSLSCYTDSEILKVIQK